MGKKQNKFNDYDGFTEKFKPKRTTDDCYTPPEVYEAIKKWVFRECALPDDTPIVRPFYPGGDYERNIPTAASCWTIRRSRSSPIS